MKTWKRIPETGIISARLCQSIAVILVKNRAGIKERESDRDKETEREKCLKIIFQAFVRIFLIFQVYFDLRKL